MSERYLTKLRKPSNSNLAPAVILKSGDYEFGNKIIDISFYDLSGNFVSELPISGGEIFDLSDEIQRKNYENILVVKKLPIYNGILFERLESSSSDIIELEAEITKLKARILGLTDSMISSIGIAMGYSTNLLVSDIKANMLKRLVDKESCKELMSYLSFDDIEERSLFKRALSKNIIVFENNNYWFKGTLNSFPIGADESTCVLFLKNSDNKSILDDIRSKVDGFNYKNVSEAITIKSESVDLFLGITKNITKGIKDGIILVDEETEGYIFDGILLGNRKSDIEDVFRKNSMLYQDFLKLIDDNKQGA